MTSTVKTPVMVLQELTVKRAMPSPEYSIIHARQGTHDNEFHYQVIAASVSAVGIGRSKQVAKHDAARKALDLLEKMGIYCPGETVVKAPRSELPNSPVKLSLSVNAIGNLGEVCLEHKIPMPTFTEISDVGPPHCKEFTYQCQIASIVTRSTAGTKKQAKQMAAKDMLERIMVVLPELVAECSENHSQQAITDHDAGAMEKYLELRKFTRAKPNLALKVEDYDLCIASSANDKEIPVEDFLVCFTGECTEDNLKKMLAKLEFDYKIEILMQTPPTIWLSVNADIPFTSLGVDETFDGARQFAISEAIAHLKLYLTPKII